MLEQIAAARPTDANLGFYRTAAGTEMEVAAVARACPLKNGVQETGVAGIAQALEGL